MEKIYDAQKCYKFNNYIHIDDNFSILDFILYIKSTWLQKYCIWFTKLVKCRKCYISSLLCIKRGRIICDSWFGFILSWCCNVFFNFGLLALPFKIDEHLLFCWKNTEEKDRIHHEWYCRTCTLYKRCCLGLF